MSFLSDYSSVDIATHREMAATLFKQCYKSNVGRKVFGYVGPLIDSLQHGHEALPQTLEEIDRTLSKCSMQANTGPFNRLVFEYLRRISTPTTWFDLQLDYQQWVLEIEQGNFLAEKEAAMRRNIEVFQC